MRYPEILLDGTGSIFNRLAGYGPLVWGNVEGRTVLPGCLRPDSLAVLALSQAPWSNGTEGTEVSEDICEREGLRMSRGLGNITGFDLYTSFSTFSKFSVPMKA